MIRCLPRCEGDLVSAEEFSRIVVQQRIRFKKVRWTSCRFLLYRPMTRCDISRVNVVNNLTDRTCLSSGACISQSFITQTGQRLHPGPRGTPTWLEGLRFFRGSWCNAKSLRVAWSRKRGWKVRVWFEPRIESAELTRYSSKIDFTQCYEVCLDADTVVTDLIDDDGYQSIMTPNITSVFRLPIQYSRYSRHHCQHLRCNGGMRGLSNV